MQNRPDLGSDSPELYPIMSMQDIIASYDDIVFENEIKRTSDEDQGFLSLFRNIRLNKKLLNKLGVLYSKETDEFSIVKSSFQNEHAKQISEFHNAIKQGDLRADVFKNREGLTYCLLLLKERKISFDQAMTVYAFMLAQGQFAANQADRFIFVEDKDRKGPIICELSSFVEDGKLSVFGNSYFNYISKVIPNIDRQAFEYHVLSLPASEHWVTELHYTKDDYNHFNNNGNLSRPTELMISALSSLHDQGMFPGIVREDRLIFCVPSVSVIQYLLSALSPNHMRLRFGFGRIGEGTLYKDHKANDHFVPLSHPDVKSNMTEAHKFSCGPYLVLIHDFSHTFWASCLSLQERLVLLNDVRPSISKLKKLLLSKKLHSGLELTVAEVRLFDFDLEGYEPRAFDHYLYKSLFIVIKDNYFRICKYGYQPVLGETLADKLYMLIALVLSKNHLTDKELVILQYIRDRVYPEVDGVVYDANRKIIDEIRRLEPLKSYQALSCDCQQKIQDIDWQAWHAMLTQHSQQPAKLWQQIISDRNRYDEYVLLSRYAGLKFLYPYLPFSRVHLTKFKSLVAERLQACAQTKVEKTTAGVSRKRVAALFFKSDQAESKKPEKKAKVELQVKAPTKR